MTTHIKLSALALSLAIGGNTMAGPRQGSDNAAPEQRLKLETEWQQARDAGGYDDPVTALMAFLNAEDPGRNLQPVINDPDADTIWDALFDKS